MKPENIRKMVTAALFAALICISTMIVLTYSPSGGYIHLGDTFVLIAGWILGPFWGMTAAAIGSALTDLILGAAVYVPATFIIKGLMALAAFYVTALIRGSGKASNILKYVLSAIVGELIMVAGYFAYETVLYGIGGAAANVPLNIIQGASGIVLASLIIHPLMKIRYLREMNQ